MVLRTLPVFVLWEKKARFKRIKEREVQSYGEQRCVEMDGEGAEDYEELASRVCLVLGLCLPETPRTHVLLLAHPPFTV